MNNTPLIAGVLSLLSLNAFASDNEMRSMVMGDGTVRGERIQDYEFTWLQCAKQGDAWTDGGPLTETYSAAGDDARVTQRTKQSNGMVIVSTTIFDRSSLAPRRMEQTVTDPDGNTLMSISRKLDISGYSGQSTQGDQVANLSGVVTSQMWHGNNLGLVLATIDPASYPVEFASSMISFDGTYRTIATLAGRETLDHEDTTVEILLVDVEWHHNETGDVYPPGPDASGGRYWLAIDPPPGIPYVPQYRTDTYIVSTLLEDCSG